MPHEENPFEEYVLVGIEDISERSKSWEHQVSLTLLDMRDPFNDILAQVFGKRSDLVCKEQGISMENAVELGHWVQVLERMSEAEAWRLLTKAWKDAIMAHHKQLAHLASQELPKKS